MNTDEAESTLKDLANFIEEKTTNLSLIYANRIIAMRKSVRI